MLTTRPFIGQCRSRAIVPAALGGAPPRDEDAPVANWDRVVLVPVCAGAVGANRNAAGLTLGEGPRHIGSLELRRADPPPKCKMDAAHDGGPFVRPTQESLVPTPNGIHQIVSNE